jgi:hypothetical protein
MAKRADSVVGIDLGKHVLKGVALRRRSDSRFILTNFASRPVPEEFDSAEDLSRELKQLLCDLGGSAKACAFAVSDPSTILRIIEQPDTPVDLLRNALRFNGLAVLNQECKDFVLDVAPAASQVDGGSIMENPSAAGSKRAVQSGVVTQTKYLVGGMLRSQVKQIVAAANKIRLSAEMLQLAPVCSFNAFEFAYPEIFANDAFLLLDTGHLQSTVLIGSRSELVLVRSIDYGGKALMQALTAEDALDADAAWLMIQQGDEGMTEICRGSRWRAWERKCAIRLDFSKVNAKKASTEFLFPGVWLARKRFCRRRRPVESSARRHRHRAHLRQ